LPSMPPPGGRPPVPNKWAALNEDKDEDDDDEPPPATEKETSGGWTDEEWREWKKQQWKEKHWKDEKWQDDDWKTSSSWKEKWWEKDWGRGEDEEDGAGSGTRRWSDAKEKGKGGTNGRWEWQEDDSPERCGDTWEHSREETGLQLIGEIAPEDAEWEYILLDESRRSYAAFLPCPFDEAQCASFFQRVKEGTEWKQPENVFGKLVPRQTAWMTKRGCKCTYRYGGIEVEAQEFPPFMMELLRASMHYCGITNERDWPDSCNLNYYEDGGASVGWHADDESLFQGKHQDIRIVSLSFGQSRTFELRRNWPEGDELGVERIVLSNGDLMTMEGMTQKHFQHRVPKERCEGPRINLTWRWVRKHHPKCPLAGNRR